MGHGVAQHATLLFFIEALAGLGIGALAGDHQHMLEPARLRGLQEPPELRMGVALPQAVQIEPRFDLDPPLVELSRGLPVERRGAWKMAWLR